MAKRKIIDANCNWFPCKEIIGEYLYRDMSCKDMAPYLERVYGPRLERYHGIRVKYLLELRDRVTPQEFRAECEKEAERAAIPVDEFAKMLDDAGVEKAVFFRIDEETPTGVPPLPLDWYADLMNKKPDKFIAFTGVDLGKGIDGVRELERAVKELNFKGYVLRPFVTHIYAHDRRCYPFYAKCVELDIPVWFHASINFGQAAPMDLGSPRYLDYVACDFPELKIIVGHAGWPWVTETVALAWKHPNVYIDLSLMRAKYVGMPDSGWGPLVRYGNSVIQDKILFTSAWWILAMPLNEIIAENDSLITKEEARQKWFYENAARLLHIQ